MRTRHPRAPADPSGEPGHHRPEQQSPERQPPAPKPTRRPWSPRRVAATVTAFLIMIVAGALLFEAVWTRTGQHANAWWTTLSDEFATRRIDDVWIMTGAAVAAALGLLLVVLALTPGMRRRLPVRAPEGSPAKMRAVIDRKGAALLLRDAAMRVPGVSAARVHLHRRRVKVRADVRFRDTDEVKTDLTDAIRRATHDQLGLAREPKPVIRMRRSPT